MNVATLLTMAFVALAAGSVADAAGSNGSRAALLCAFRTQDDLRGIAAADGASAALADDPAASGQRVLSARFEKGTWPSLKWQAPAGSAWDWSRNSTLAVDVTNPTDAAETFNIRVDDGTPVWKPRPLHVHSASATIAAHASGTYFVDLSSAANPVDPGMQCDPPIKPRPGMIAMNGVGSVDPSHIVSYSVFVTRPLSPEILLVKSVRLLPGDGSDERFTGIVDRFGQYTRADWPGKVHDAAELRGDATAGGAHSGEPAAPAGRDVYGGWADGPLLKATGSFRTERRDGRWWFVDPDGRLYLAMGAVSPGMSEPTLVTAREKMFTWLPSPGEPLARFYGQLPANVFSGPVKSGSTYDFLAANLYRKFGDQYAQPWKTETLDRLKAWGLNSISGWAMDLQGGGAVPFMKVMGSGNRHSTIPAGGWGPMDDPWDPHFAGDAAARFQANVRPLADDPMCIGFMIGNELSWGRASPGSTASDHYCLATAALSLGADSPAKRYFVGALRDKYVDITALDRAWGCAAPDWDTFLDKPFTAPASLNAAMQADCSQFLADYADLWFRTVRDALKKAAPNKLFLGCRFAQYTPEAVAAAAKYADAVSFNIYHVTALDPAQWGFLQSLNKPALVSEWHFGALDRGLFGVGLGEARDQADRASCYRRFAGDLLDNPAIVGQQWFKYDDEPLTGETFSGENFNIGLVTVTDRPYPELVSAVREISEQAYPRHMESKGSR